MTVPLALTQCGKPSKDGAIRVTDLFEKKGYAPVLRHLPPLWQLPVPAALRSAVHGALVPVLAWRRSIAEGTPMTDIDGTAAYVSAASSAQFAHGRLQPAGVGGAADPIRPGYYLVDAHHWGAGAPGSPLGAADINSPRVWVAAPTYGILRDLTRGSVWCEAGMWPDDTVYDSWQSETVCRFTRWTNALRDIRAYAMEAGDGDVYEGLKLGYSQAVQMWGTPPDPKGTPREKCEKKNLAYRPDWAHTLRANHAANLWRRAYVATQANHPPVAVGGTGHATDGLAFTTSDLTALLSRSKPPFRLDESRIALGTFHTVRRYITGEES